MTGLGHNPNSTLSALCQLWPAADITLLGLPPLCANSGREQVQQDCYLLDDLVGAGEQRGRHFEAEHPCGLSINDELELAHLLDRQFPWLCTLEDATGID